MSRVRRIAAALPALALTCAPLLSGCSFWNSVFHRSHDHGCFEKPFRGNIENLQGLQVPEGMTPPDPRNQIRIPKLTEPERVRAKTEPCLSQPPSYASGSSIALPTRTGVPMGAPAPVPVPISPTEPVVPFPVPESTPAPESTGPLAPAPASPPAPATPEPPATPAPPEPPILEGPR